MAHSKSSKKWLKEHFSDQYVKEAKKLGYRNRASFKLIEIQKSYRLIKPNMTIVDLGSAPGGWSQMAAKWLRNSGHVFALDILPMAPILGVEFIQGDFREEKVFNDLLSRLEKKKVDLVMSDMSPNISGIKAADQASSMYLAELSLDLALRVLMTNGSFLVKVFQGEGFDEYLKELKKRFSRVICYKPRSSRSRSREIYLLGMGLK